MKGFSLVFYVVVLVMTLERGIATTISQVPDREDYVVIFRRSNQAQRDEHHAWLRREVLFESHEDAGVQNHIYFDDEFSGYHGKFTEREASLIAGSKHVEYIHKSVKRSPRTAILNAPRDLYNDGTQATNFAEHYESTQTDSHLPDDLDELHADDENRIFDVSLFDRSYVNGDPPMNGPTEPVSATKSEQPVFTAKSTKALSTNGFIRSPSFADKPDLSASVTKSGQSSHANKLVELSDSSTSFQKQVQKRSSWTLGMLSHKNPTNSTDYVYNTARNKNVMIYVIDTGIYVDHQEFAGKQIRFNVDQSKLNSTELLHGTGVASVACGNSLGVAKDAELVSVYFAENVPPVVLLNWVADDFQKPENKGKKAVINFSFEVDNTTSFQTAVKKIQTLGMPFVIALANEERSECDYLKFIDNDMTVMVGSVRRDYKKFTPSAYGECVDVFAPGGWMRVAESRSSASYLLAAGTSFAAPHVAGTIAYLWGQDINLEAREAIKKATQSNPNRIAPDTLKGSPNNLVYNGAA